MKNLPVVLFERLLINNLEVSTKFSTFATRIDDSTIQKEDYPMAEEKLVVQD